uniref:G-protein coupled receptors family 1 profile domain-containing protein n=1 Tax=Panagrolaimus davidi TaxID=227884 RepID=A0A914PT74_9BILA
MLCWKPIRLFPYTVLLPVGIWQPMSSSVSALFLVFSVTITGTIIDTLGLILVERHFLIVADKTKNIKKQRILIYSLTVLTEIAEIIPICLLVFSQIDEESVCNLLKSDINNIEQILNIQPSLFMINLENATLIKVLLT